MSVFVKSDEKDPRPGDIVFAHSNGIMGRAIRFGEFLRWRKGSHWNHACVVSRIGKDGTAYVIQADIHGVNEAPLESVGEYIILEPPAGVSRVKILNFTRNQVGSKYGILSIVSIVFDILSPNWFPSLRRKNSWICSAVTGEALRFGGWLQNWPDVYTVTPAQLFDAVANIQ
jgi:hypothetical protein